MSKKKEPSYQPSGDRVLVRVDERQEKSNGGIILPDVAKQKPQRGEVLAVGPGRYSEEGHLLPMSVNIGDVVLFGRYAGDTIQELDEDLLFVRESEILAKVEP